MHMKTIVVVGMLLAATRLEACAPMSGDNSGVQVTEESAVIVWDAKNQTEHFIRRAHFNGSGKSLGFLVPSPSVPRLVEADDAVFSQLEILMEPEVIHKKVSAYRLRSIFNQVKNTFNAAGMSMMNTASDPVEIIDTQRVGNYDATILRATDAAALGRWLDKNGYSSNTAFEDWLDIYIKKHWYITAFKIAKTDESQAAFTLAPVRMSFQTPRPFYPYREPRQQAAAAPKNQTASSRSLRIFFFAPNRMQAVPGTFKASREWPGKVKWADAAARHDIDWKGIAGHLKLSEQELKSTGRLTVFEDFSSPRSGTDDVFFEATENQQTLPEPIVITQKVEKPIFIEWFLLAGASVAGLGALGVRRRRK